MKTSAALVLIALHSTLTLAGSAGTGADVVNSLESLLDGLKELIVDDTLPAVHDVVTIDEVPLERSAEVNVKPAAEAAAKAGADEAATAEAAVFFKNLAAEVAAQAEADEAAWAELTWETAAPVATARAAAEPPAQSPPPRDEPATAEVPASPTASVLTHIFLSRQPSCPTGMVLAGAQAPQSSHAKFDGNLNEGIQPAPRLELSRAGCACARGWSSTPTVLGPSGNGRRHFYAGCAREPGEVPWCVIDPKCTARHELGAVAPFSSRSRMGAASTMFDFGTTPESISSESSKDVHHCKDVAAQPKHSTALCALPLSRGASGSEGSDGVSKGAGEKSTAPEWRGATWGDAERDCFALGARLPTLAEALTFRVASDSSSPAAPAKERSLLFVTGVPRNQRVWTIDNCFVVPGAISDADSGPGKIAVRVDESTGGVVHECTAFNRSAARVCVTAPQLRVRAESGAPLAVASVAWAASSEGVCGNIGPGAKLCSAIGYEACPPKEAYQASEFTCRRIGARLPTLSELQLGAFAHTKPGRVFSSEGEGRVRCSLQAQYLWSSTPCFLDETDATATGKMVAAPTLSGAKRKDREPKCVSSAQSDDVDSRYKFGCVALGTAQVRMPLHTTGDIPSVPLQNGDLAISPHRPWDWCEGNEHPGPRTFSDVQITWSGCKCEDEWEDNFGTHYGCSLSPMGEGRLDFTERLPNGASLSWCKVKKDSCWKVFPATREASVPKKMGSLAGTHALKQESYDMCFDAPPPDDKGASIYICIQREPIATAPPDRVVRDLFLAHSTVCPPPFELVDREEGLDGSLTQFTFGITILLCVLRGGAGGEAGGKVGGGGRAKALAAIDDIIVSGGNSSVLSCPCGYNTPNHTDLDHKPQYNFPVEIPLNLYSPPLNSFNETYGRYWYTFLCTHRVIDAGTQRTIAARKKMRATETEKTLTRLRDMQRSGDDAIVVFIFLVYHEINNEVLWKRYFDTAPEHLRDSWRLVLHHKATFSKGREHDQNLLSLGPWATRMKEEGKLIIVPFDRLVKTAYCETSLVSAALVALEVAVEHNEQFGGRIEELVLVSGDSIPIRSFECVSTV